MPRRSAWTWSQKVITIEGLWQPIEKKEKLGAKCKSAAKPPSSGTAVTAAANSVPEQATAAPVADTASGEATAEPDYTFQDECTIDVKDFLREWSLNEQNCLAELAFDPHWPGDRVSQGEEVQKSADSFVPTHSGR